MADEISDGAARRNKGGSFWMGVILSGLPVLMLLMDGVMKLMKPDPVIKGTMQLGYPVSVITPLGIVLLSCVALYVLPPTAVLGAVLLTGYLGGAVASHVRHGDPLFSHILAPTYVAIFLWAGLLFREPRLRAIFPLRCRGK